MATIYLDHNILNALLKKRVPTMRCLHEVEAPVYVYSDANLAEILNSKGYEVQFLNLLSQLRAMYLSVPHVDGRVVGEASFSRPEPQEACMNLSDAVSTSPDGQFGLDLVLQKFYGGNSDESFSEIADRGAEDLCSYLDETLAAVENELPPEKRTKLRDALALLKESVAGSSADMASVLDANFGRTPVLDWQAKVGVGPQQLNNIRPPKIMEQIWAMLEPNMPEDLEMKVLFGLEVPHDPERAPRSDVERVNVICHMLEYIGFHRDRRIKQLRRLNASLADMTHAGYASLCDYLLTDDFGLHRRALAAYEHLELPCQSLYANLKAHES